MAPERRFATTSGFVRDGKCRLRAAVEPEIYAQVIAEFAAQLAAASVWQRWWLRIRIAREVARRLDELVSPANLY